MLFLFFKIFYHREHRAHRGGCAVKRGCFLDSLAQTKKFDCVKMKGFDSLFALVCYLLKRRRFRTSVSIEFQREGYELEVTGKKMWDDASFQ